MSIPVRSIRLQKRTSNSLDVLSGSSGEIFFDADQNTLRIYTANQSDSIVLADRMWVQENTFNGNFQDLTNKPVIPTDLRDLSDIDNRLFSGAYADLTGAPDLESLNVDISTIDSVGDVDTTTNPLAVGQLLEWDGTNWVNTTIAGFEDTDTTYALSNIATANGANVVLTDVGGDTTTTEIVGGTNITVGINISGQIEVSSALPTLGQLSDTVVTTPADGQLLGYNSGQWINVAAPVATGGVELTDLSATNDAASGAGSLAYDSALGVFTFTPPDLSTYATTSSFSVTTNAANAGGSLSYSAGVFTFRPALVNNLIALTDLSVVSNAASGTGSLTYSNTTGQFTFTPPDSAGGDVVDDTTPQLGGNLDLNTNDITGAGDINITGTITGTNFSSGAVGAPVITSASTITLTAPDGVIIESVSRISELMSNDGTAVSGTRTFDTSISPIEYITGATANITVNFTNVPTTNDVSHSFSVVIDQSATAFIINAIQIAGAVQTILWADGSAPSGTNSGTDVFTFTLLRRSSAWTVLGSATSYS